MTDIRSLERTLLDDLPWNNSASAAKFSLRSADIPGDSSRYTFGYLSLTGLGRNNS